MKAKKMTKKQKEAFESMLEKRVNSDIKWMIGAVQHELDLSEECITNGEEKRQ